MNERGGAREEAAARREAGEEPGETAGARTEASCARRILYCHCAYANAVPKAVKTEVLRGLLEEGAAFDAVPDLCEMTARRDPALPRLAAGDGEIRIAACYPRAVKWLFRAAGADLPEGRVRILNMRTDRAEAVLAGLLGSEVPESETKDPASEASGAGDGLDAI